MPTQFNTENRVTDELIESCMEPVQKLARSYARKLYRVEFEELYSIGMLAVCEAVERVSTLETAVAYLCKHAQGSMLNEIQRLYSHEPISLDAPLSSDEGDSFNFYDVLPAPDSSSRRSSKRVRAVNGAMRRLQSQRQRAVLRRRFALAGYGTSTVADAMQDLRITESMVRHARANGLAALRQDARLRKVMGVEVPVMSIASTALQSDGEEA